MGEAEGNRIEAEREHSEINSNSIESTKKTRLHMYKITSGSREEGARGGRGHRYLIFRPTKARGAENKGA